jgi:hypothetical protein
MKVPRTMITTVVAVQNRHADCRLPQFTGCKLTINSDRIMTVFFSHHIRLVTVVNDLKMKYPTVYAHLRNDELRP